MGETRPDERLSDAARGRSPRRLATRLSLKAFLRDQRGTTAIEYGLIIALVFLIIVTSVSVFGNKTSGLIIKVSNAIGAAVGP